MMISSNNGISVHGAATAAYTQTAAQTVATEKKDLERNFDQVTISSEKTALKDAKSQIYNELQTTTTTGTLAAIRAQIEKGEYKIDSTEIARKMLLMGQA